MARVNRRAGVVVFAGIGNVAGTLLSEDGTISLEALRTMQDVLLEHGVIKKRLPVEEHVARDFTPVKL